MSFPAPANAINGWTSLSATWSGDFFKRSSSAILYLLRELVFQNFQLEQD
jgi:hypothetical protein